MKPRFLLVPFLLMAFTITSFSQSFEGIITLKNSASSGLNATFTLKGATVLMESETAEGNVKMLSNAETGIFYMMTDKDGQKMAIKNDMNSPMMRQAMSRISSTSKANKDDIKIELTNETKMINGYSCKKVIGSSEDAEGHAWVTEAIKINFDDLIPMAKMRGGQSMNKKMENTFGTSGFIMELYSKDKKTGETFTMQAEVVEKEVNLSELEILAGYSVLDMTDMMKMMQEAQKDPKKLEQIREAMKKFERN